MSISGSIASLVDGNLVRGMLFCIALLCTTARANASEHDPPAGPLKIGVGVAAGATSGYGLNLRLDLGPKWGLSLAGVPLPPSTPLGASIALQGLRTLFARGRVRGYAVLGAHYRSVQDPLEPPIDEIKYRQEFEVAALGAGLGFEVNTGPVRFLFELPLTFVFALSEQSALAYSGDLNFTLYPNLALCVFPKKLNELF